MSLGRPLKNFRKDDMTQAKNGDTVRINYNGRLVDGTHPILPAANRCNSLGEGQVIPGLETHVEGMEVGARSTVTVPADAAYGPTARSGR